MTTARATDSWDGGIRREAGTAQSASASAACSTAPESGPSFPRRFTLVVFVLLVCSLFSATRIPPIRTTTISAHTKIRTSIGTYLPPVLSSRSRFFSLLSHVAQSEAVVATGLSDRLDPPVSTPTPLVRASWGPLGVRARRSRSLRPDSLGTSLMRGSFAGSCGMGTGWLPSPATLLIRSGALPQRDRPGLRQHHAGGRAGLVAILSVGARSLGVNLNGASAASAPRRNLRPPRPRQCHVEGVLAVTVPPVPHNCREPGWFSCAASVAPEAEYRRDPTHRGR